MLLPAEPTENRLLDPMLLVEGTSEAAVTAAAEVVAGELGIAAGEVATLQMMWRLQSSEIPQRAA